MTEFGFMPDPDAAAKAAAFPGFVDPSCLVVPVTDPLVWIGELERQLAAERERCARLERERDQWRLRAMCTPAAAEDADRAARHLQSERTGGR